jgi:hypothetical protein
MILLVTLTIDIGISERCNDGQRFHSSNSRGRIKNNIVCRTSAWSSILALSEPCGDRPQTAAFFERSVSAGFAECLGSFFEPSFR